MSKRTLASEFPPASDYTVPKSVHAAGWVDSSWHNDICPSFTHEKKGLRLWVDNNDPMLREGEGRPIYVLTRINDCEEWEEDLLATDSYDEIESRLQTINQEG